MKIKNTSNTLGPLYGIVGKEKEKTRPSQKQANRKSIIKEHPVYYIRWKGTSQIIIYSYSIHVEFKFTNRNIKYPICTHQLFFEGTYMQKVNYFNSTWSYLEIMHVDKNNKM